MRPCRMGCRAAFTFTPVAETIGGQTFYRPAWTAEGAHGFVLNSANAQLRKVGAQFFDVASGGAYNPASPLFGDQDYKLTGPNGTVYVIDSANGTVAIVSAAGTLQVSDSGVTGPGW